MPGPARSSAFLSYRRDVSWATAQLLSRELRRLGTDVFVDVSDIDGGEFGPVILRQIEARAHFLVLLEPGSLDRVADPGDWMRREIAHALGTGRAVVPVLAGGARMPAAADLPPDISRLTSFNAVTIHPDYVDEAVRKLHQRFLRDAPAFPAPAGAPRWLAEVGTPAAPSVKRFNTLLRVTWGAVPGAAGYELWGSADEQRLSRDDRVYQGPATSYADDLLRTTPLLWFRVRVVDRRVGPGPWSAAVRTPDPPPPAAPFLRLRFRGFRGALLEWEPVPDAREYEVQSSVGTGFAAPVVVQRGAQARCADRSGRAGSSVYRVRASFDDGTAGPWSETALG